MLGLLPTVMSWRHARVARALRERVDRGVDETGSRLSVRDGPLVDEREEPGPARRGRARAAYHAAGPLPAEVVVDVAVHGHVGHVAHRARRPVGRVRDPHLVGRDRELALARSTAAGGPRGLRGPAPALGRRDHAGAADSGHVGVFCRVSGVVGVVRVVGAPVSRRVEEALALRGELLENRLGFGAVRHPEPRRAQLLGDVLGRHLVENGDVARRLHVIDVDAHLAQPRRHPDRLHDVQDDLDVVAARFRGRAIERHGVDRHRVRHADAAERQVDVAAVVAKLRQDPDRLTLAGERRAAVIGGPEIGARVRAVRPGADRRALDWERPRCHVRGAVRD